MATELELTAEEKLHIQKSVNVTIWRMGYRDGLTEGFQRGKRTYSSSYRVAMGTIQFMFGALTGAIVAGAMIATLKMSGAL